MIEQNTGAELIAEERREQIEKHHYDTVGDASYYSRGELVNAALHSINPSMFAAPADWDPRFTEKIRSKDRIGRLKVAGALLAAEIDRVLYVEKTREEI